MITKEKAKEIGDAYLKDSKMENSSIYPIEKIGYIENFEIKEGKRKGEKSNVFLYHFNQIWGMDERTLTLYIDAESEEPIYIITPHGYIYIEE